MKTISKYFRGALTHLLLIVIFSLCSITVWAQGYYTYWFDVPEVSRYHTPANRAINVYLHLTATQGGMVKVRLSLPAEPNFTPKVFEIPANGKIRVNLASQSATPGPNELNGMFQPFQNGNLRIATTA